MMIFRSILLIIGGALFVCSVALNVAQAVRNRALIDTVEHIRPDQALSVGEVVRPLEALDLNGHPGQITYVQSSTPTVLYIFRPSCIWCTRNVAVFNAFVQQVVGRYRVIGISLSPEGLTDYVKEHNMVIPVFLAQPSAINDYRLRTTPQTMVISSDAHVIQSWSGAYTPRLQPILEEYFSIKLPSLGGG